jgi:hypothetical protein
MKIIIRITADKKMVLLIAGNMLNTKAVKFTKEARFIQLQLERTLRCIEK